MTVTKPHTGSGFPESLPTIFPCPRIPSRAHSTVVGSSGSLGWLLRRSLVLMTSQFWGERARHVTESLSGRTVCWVSWDETEVTCSGQETTCDVQLVHQGCRLSAGLIILWTLASTPWRRSCLSRLLPRASLAPSFPHSIL